MSEANFSQKLWSVVWKVLSPDWLLDKILQTHPMLQRSNLVSYAEKEMKLAGLYDADAAYGPGALADGVLKMIKLMALEGHSGNSHGIAMNLVKTVGSFRPLTPLTGDDDEWTECGDGYFQNKRCYSVFKENGKAYRSDGKVFFDGVGHFTSSKSRVPITFPWTWTEPKIVRVKP